MISLLRKIRKSLIDSASARKYILYAIGEIALVVIGILIALQINNNNEWRKDRVVERKVLEDIRDNINRNNLLIESALQRFDQINNSTEIVKEVIRKKLAYSDTLNFHFSQSIRHGGFLLRLNTDGYESLKNRGFEIIQNQDLLDHILSLFEVSYSDYIMELEWANSVYLGGYGWWKEYFFVIENDLFVPVDYNKMLNDRTLLSELNEIAEVRASIQRQIENCYSHNKRVLAFVLEELGG